MKSILIIVSLFIFQYRACQNEHFIKNSSYQIFEGFITEESESEKIFLQDHEAGDLVELRFFYDSPEGIDFKEFNYVEVKGYYNNSRNMLLVEELYPLNQKGKTKPSINTLASVH